MIRVIYRWSVDPDQRTDFETAWSQGTARIRREETGALGSTLLQSPEEPDTWIGLARWRSRADLEAFWTSQRAVPLPGATLISTEVLDERTHLTEEDRPAGQDAADARRASSDADAHGRAGTRRSHSAT